VTTDNTPGGEEQPPPAEPRRRGVRRLGVRTGQLMFRPVRAVARSGGTVVVRELEDITVDAVAAPAVQRAVDRILAGPLPETVTRSLVEHRVAERVVTEALRNEDGRVEELVEALVASPAFERMVHDALESKITADLADQVLRSPTFEHALGEVLGSPHTRAALARQSSSLAGEAGLGLRRRAARLDDSAERRPRRWFRRAPRPAAALRETPYAGMATRAVAIAVDALLVALVVLTVAAMVGLVGSLAGGVHAGWVAGLIAGAGWLVVEALYFVGFWTTAGQTPGMRLLRLRVSDHAGAPPSPGRALVRFVGLLLAIIPCFAGFLPVLVDDRRRALQDFLAGTVVVYDEAFDPAPAPSGPGGSPQVGDGLLRPPA
jgi:uncharacterized RDD family membrane protein YckC